MGVPGDRDLQSGRRDPPSAGRGWACAGLFVLYAAFAIAVALWTTINIGPN